VGAAPTTLDGFLSSGGYAAMARAAELGPAGVIAEVKASGLKGRGGAAFPCGVKWEAVAAAPARPHYLICNADESEPGTFKDRVLLEGDPFSVLEGMALAAFASGSEKGYLYLRGEYPGAARILEEAIDAARRAGYLGADVGGLGFAFDIELRRGQGAYICGEETALMNSIEGKRGEPRNKPPFPTEVGLFGRPTVVNNVETLANVADIVLGGGAAYAALGTPQSTGTKLFCLSGAVGRPGVYEVPFGVTLGGLLEMAGGLTGELQFILLGGAAGAIIGPDQLDLPLTMEDARARGLSLGSGAVMAFDTSADLADVLLRVARFFRHESCGQCVPCRVGTVRQEEALRRVLAGSNGTDHTLLQEIARVMVDASICGLGQTAAGAVLTGLELMSPSAAGR
jgi:NADH-quinone oxidoreductase subunit F